MTVAAVFGFYRPSPGPWINALTLMCGNVERMRIWGGNTNQTRHPPYGVCRRNWNEM
jgi:hypothetical protein